MSDTIPATILAVVIIGCGFALALTVILLRKIGHLQRAVERYLTSVNANMDAYRAELVRRREDQIADVYQSLSSNKLNTVIALLQSLKSEIVQEIKMRASVERPVAASPEIVHLQQTRSANENSQLTETDNGSSSEVSTQMIALQIGEQALVLLDREGRTNAIASIPGLNAWVSANWNGFVAEAILSREETWLVAVLAKSQEKRGIVIPALDTVIGAGAVSDWFECRGYDGTRVLQRQNVLQLAEAVRDEVGKPWRVDKKGLISREVGAGN